MQKRSLHWKAPFHGHVGQDTACQYYFSHLPGFTEQGAAACVQTQTPSGQHRYTSITDMQVSVSILSRFNQPTFFLKNTI